MIDGSLLEKCASWSKAFVAYLVVKHHTNKIGVMHIVSI